MGGGWILEIDIRKFFDTLGHGPLREVLHQRVRDGVLLRLIGKWLNAGVLEDGVLTYPETGTPQGGVISPMLANIFLHRVLDEWFEKEVKPRMKGKAQLIRYADDAVILFSAETDARRVHDVLPKRFGRYGLELHPEKTRLIEFRKPGESSSKERPKGERSFDVLGLTHFWAKASTGRWYVKRKTASDRFRAGLKRVADWCQRHRHDPIRVQQEALKRKVRGHYGYYGVVSNTMALRRFVYEVKQAWWRALRRWSQRPMPYRVMDALLRRFPLPYPHITFVPKHRVANP